MMMPPRAVSLTPYLRFWTISLVDGNRMKVIGPLTAVGMAERVPIEGASQDGEPPGWQYEWFMLVPGLEVDDIRLKDAFETPEEALDAAEAEAERVNWIRKQQGTVADVKAVPWAEK